MINREEIDKYASDTSAIAKKLEEFKSRKSLYWKPAKGKNEIRILPPVPPANTFYHDAAGHYNVGGRFYTCNRSFEKPCRICRRSDEWLASSDTRLLKLGHDISARSQNLVNMIDLAHPETGVQTATLPDTVLQELVGLYMEPDYGNFTHPETGFDVVWMKEGEGLRTKHQVRLRPKSTPLAERKWLKKMKDLTTVMRPYKKADVIEALDGMEKGKGEKDADDKWND